MKRLVLLSLLLIILIAALIIPFNKQVTIKINASYFNCYQQLFTPGNWKKWQPDINKDSSAYKENLSSNGFRIDISGKHFLVKKQDSYNLLVTRVTDNNKLNYSFTIIPDSKGLTTTVAVTFKVNGLACLMKIFKDDDLNNTGITSFKNYMEDVRLYYGFLIKREQTPEKMVAVKRSTFLKSDLYRQSNMMQAKLNDFVSQNHLKVVYPLQLQYVSHKGDSLQILMGLPVNKKVAIINNSIEYMNMPRGKILAGYFKGIYKDKEKLYKAMQMYMNDNYIHPMIFPFERFENNKLPTSDTTLVEMQVMIPYM
ncbi:hypothetical protein [Mucilaginibacter sp. OK098]|uniref:hypothetical protein n=1 Tax=Mucilaginibacter sp. OK098 TaxID=1855297 RepID=UPI00091E4342|nr:hypothetical protein [Mucilaginibacter sp. OK098]SHN21405.1 effector-binding domain-containing protein [Mucilaginibacter sp. OK098]